MPNSYRIHAEFMPNSCSVWLWPQKYRVIWAFIRPNKILTFFFFLLLDISATLITVKYYIWNVETSIDVKWLREIIQISRTMVIIFELTLISNAIYVIVSRNAVYHVCSKRKWKWTNIERSVYARFRYVLMFGQVMKNQNQLMLCISHDFVENENRNAIRMSMNPLILLIFIRLHTSYMLYLHILPFRSYNLGSFSSFPTVVDSCIGSTAPVQHAIHQLCKPFISRSTHLRLTNKIRSSICRHLK